MSYTYNSEGLQLLECSQPAMLQWSMFFKISCSDKPLSILGFISGPVTEPVLSITKLFFFYPEKMLYMKEIMAVWGFLVLNYRCVMCSYHTFWNVVQYLYFSECNRFSVNRCCRNVFYQFGINIGYEFHVHRIVFNMVIIYKFLVQKWHS